VPARVRSRAHPKGSKLNVCDFDYPVKRSVHYQPRNGRG
jgi:hypothetical protein